MTRGLVSARGKRGWTSAGRLRMEDKQRASLLVVDDDRVTRETYRRVLQQLGYEVETAVDGKEALARIAARQFDAVLLDNFMPGLSGRDVLRRIREHDSVLPVIMVTGDSESRSEAAGLRQ